MSKPKASRLEKFAELFPDIEGVTLDIDSKGYLTEMRFVHVNGKAVKVTYDYDTRKFKDEYD